MGCLVIPKQMQLNIETKKEGRERREKLRKGDSLKSLSGCFSILSARYCHLVAKLKMEIETLESDRGGDFKYKEQVTEFKFGFLNQYNSLLFVFIMKTDDWINKKYQIPFLGFLPARPQLEAIRNYS